MRGGKGGVRAVRKPADVVRFVITGSYWFAFVEKLLKEFSNAKKTRRLI